MPGTQGAPAARFDANVFPSLLQLIERLRELSGDAAHRAGRDYLRGTSLTQGAISGSTASAVVIGRTEYKVTISFEADPVPSCTCPANRRNRYCKHVVAICLALVEKPDLFSIVERVLPPPQPKRTRRPRGEGSARSRQAALRAEQQAAGLAMIDRLLDELAGGGLAALGREGSALLSGAAETVAALKLRRLGRLLTHLQRMAGDDPDPERFAEILQEIWIVRRALASQADGSATLEPWLTEELLGKTWRDKDLERVSGLNLLPLADTQSDDGDFRVEASHFIDLSSGAMVCERVISPLAIRASRKTPRRHRLQVEDAGLYPGVSPRRIKFFDARSAATREEDISRVLSLADDAIPQVHGRLIERMAEPFAEPEVSVLFTPQALLTRSRDAGAVDRDRRFLSITLPESWRRDLPGLLPPAGRYALFGTLSLRDTGPRLHVQSVVGTLAWDRGPVYPDRP